MHGHPNEQTRARSEVASHRLFGLRVESRLTAARSPRIFPSLPQACGETFELSQYVYSIGRQRESEGFNSVGNATDPIACWHRYMCNRAFQLIAKEQKAAPLVKGRKWQGDRPSIHNRSVCELHYFQTHLILNQIGCSIVSFWPFFILNALSNSPSTWKKEHSLRTTLPILAES